jgi:hypothetical protein
MLDIFTRWFLHVERRHPPPGFSVEVADNLSDINSCLEADADRQAARYEADQQAPRRRWPPADDWLRQ